jgi:hypothetical protein
MKESFGLKKIIWGFLAIWGWAFLSLPVMARDVSASASDANVFNHETFAQPKRVSQPVVSTQAPVTIETRWDSLWGMKYYQNDSELSELQLKSLLQSSNDSQIKDLLEESDSDETLGTLGLCTSVTASLVCLVLPTTNLSLGTLKISLPYLPLQLPALAMGVVAAFFKNAGGAAQFAAVQRYNNKAVKPAPLTWNLTPESNGLILDLKYAL